MESEEELHRKAKAFRFSSNMATKQKRWFPQKTSLEGVSRHPALDSRNQHPPVGSYRILKLPRTETGVALNRQKLKGAARRCASATQLSAQSSMLLCGISVICVEHEVRIW